MISDETKQKLIEELAKTPLVSVACKRAGLSRATFYRWMEESRTFKRECNKAMEEGRSLINDMAESGLIRGIQKQDMGAIKHWLTFNHPRYSKREKTYEDDGQIRGLLDQVKANIVKREQKPNIPT